MRIAIGGGYTHLETARGAAKLLPRGRAVEIGVWSQKDQSKNSREATLRNAEIEGVFGRVEVRDGDMRRRARLCY